MPPNLDQFIKLADAPDTYRVSIKTLRRRRDKARNDGNATTFTNFIVRTRDGEIYEQPPTDLINKLTKQGRLPEWLVRHHWLQCEFGPRSNVTTQGDAQKDTDDQPQDNPDDQGKTAGQEHDQPVDHPKPDQSPQQQINAVYEGRIEDLKEQLRVAREREKEIRDDAKEDKNLFAEATNKLRLLIPSQTRRSDELQERSVTKQGTELLSKPSQTKQRSKPKRRGFLDWLR